MKSRWFANVVLLLGAAGSFGAAGMALRISLTSPVGTARGVLFVGGCALLGVALLAGLRLPLEARVALAMTLISLVVAAYGAEAYLRELPLLKVRWESRRLGLSYDSRSQFEVVRDLRGQGVEAWPAVFPAWQGLRHDGSSLLPLGGISRVHTVFCNELGPYVVYPSDEHGFHNPEGTWSSPAIDIAVLGDSFTQGACIPDEQDFVGLLRRAHPRTLNLGMLGNGPLLMLAGLREFLVELKPRIVLWIYTEGNDLTVDLHREKGYPSLVEYLNPGHSQGLRRRQQDVDALLRGLIDREFRTRQSETALIRVPPRFFRLWALRQALGLFLVDTQQDHASADLSLFRQILQEAQTTSRGWGGELYVVYLPSEARYIDETARRQCDRTRERVLSILRELRVPLIDFHPPALRHPDVRGLFAFPGGHFSPDGNRLLAETILAALHTMPAPPDARVP